MLGAVHEQLRKYISRLPAYVVSEELMLHVAIYLPLQFYTALSQIVARIGHANPSVHGLLADIVIKVVSTHPQQALWTLLALVKSSNKERAQRGATCLTKILV